MPFDDDGEYIYERPGRYRAHFLAISCAARRLPARRRLPCRRSDVARASPFSRHAREPRPPMSAADDDGTAVSRLHSLQEAFLLFQPILISVM